MDAFLDIISVRAVRQYSDRSIPEESLHRILEAGRVAASAQNRQPWRFYVIRKREHLNELARAVYEPGNLESAQLAIGLATTSQRAFDIGRAAQNMVLAAWSEGIGSSPNGARDRQVAEQVLGVAEGESLATILSFGYPLQPRHPNPNDTEGILRRINRKPLDEIVVWVD